jgi:hypothetical protein
MVDTPGRSGERMKPTLVVNPAGDDVFAAFAEVLVHDAMSTAELERRLHAVYPRAAVHARELAGESIIVWYVYRDGHWVLPRPGTGSGARANDARYREGSPSDRRIDQS